MRDTLTSPRVEDMKRKRRAYRKRLAILSAILFITLTGALAYFSSYSRVSINRIVVSGTRIINPRDVESQVRSDMTGKYLRLFNRSNSLIYPIKKIRTDLLATFPRIETLSIYRDSLTTLHIAITERSGSYLYCGATVPEAPADIGENCYFINSDGYIFDKAPYFSGNVYFKYYMQIEGKDSSNTLGSQMTRPEDFHLLLQFVDGITSLGFKPTYLVIDESGVGTLYLAHTDVATSPQIIFKSRDDLKVILDNLRVSMAKPEFANEINGKYNTLLYIDLRFDNKVVYKFSAQGGSALGGQ